MFLNVLITFFLDFCIVYLNIIFVLCFNFSGKELPGPGTVISSLEARFINPCMGKYHK